MGYRRQAVLRARLHSPSNRARTDMDQTDYLLVCTPWSDRWAAKRHSFLHASIAIHLLIPAEKLPPAEPINRGWANNPASPSRRCRFSTLKSWSGGSLCSYCALYLKGPLRPLAARPPVEAPAAGATVSVSHRIPMGEDLQRTGSRTEKTTAIIFPFQYAGSDYAVLSPLSRASRPASMHLTFSTRPPPPRRARARPA